MSGEPEPAFLLLGALPCTGWLDDTAGRNPQGSILTGPAARMDNLLETDVPGLFAASDVRSGSTKRYSTAVSTLGNHAPVCLPRAAPELEPMSENCRFCNQTTRRGYETGTSARARAATRGHYPTHRSAPICRTNVSASARAMVSAGTRRVHFGTGGHSRARTTLRDTAQAVSVGLASAVEPESPCKS